MPNNVNRAPSPRKPVRICLFDPAIENHQGSPSSNLGDLIISAAVRRELAEIFKDASIHAFSTQVYPRFSQLFAWRGFDLRIVGGTNLLSSNMDSYNQWKIRRRHAFFIRDAVLLGVGWWQYQEDPNGPTRRLLRAALSPARLHSVRDGYTLQKLRAAGFENVVNTGCPTMWPLAGTTPADFPQRKCDTVLATVTDYHQKPQADRLWLQKLAAHYRRVFFWPQGRGDLDYFSGLDSRAVPLEHTVAALERFIAATPQFDYVGTRLHGGIRCLLAGRRSLILSLDNRTPEIARETNLPAVAREDGGAVEAWINGCAETRITLNLAAIGRWKEQFAT
jgi:polysaccharide pyruvyl transferase WcaK-like protein